MFLEQQEPSAYLRIRTCLSMQIGCELV